MNKKSKFILFIFIFVWISISLKVYNISVQNSDKYKRLALSNISTTKYIPTLRGNIYDRNNIPLAINNIGFSLSLKAHLKEKILDKELSTIKKYLSNVNIKKLKKKYKKRDSKYSHSQVEIITFIKYDDIINIYSKLHINPNIYMKPSFKRIYPYKELTAHIVGYVSRNQKAIDKISKYTKIIPKSGIELYYNKHLQGELNFIKYKVNAFNEKIKEEDKFISKKNNHLKLSLDIKLQKFIYDLLLKDKKIKAGVVLVSKIESSDILASVSYPSFDPNIFSSKISSKVWKKLSKNKYKPFTNKAIKGLYPPASIVKMGVAMSFLKDGLKKRESFFCTGSHYFAGRKFRCWNSKGHGEVNMNRAIRESCDDYFYKGSYKVGINKISDTLQYFGFGHKTGIDLVGEKIGVSPNKNWKLKTMKRQWFIGETFLSSIGQGNTLSTPMQVHKYLTSIASGKITTPHFIKQLGDKIIEFNASKIENKLYKKSLKAIKKAMYQACNYPSGTGYKYVQNSQKTMACKTGTAQVVSISQSATKRLKEQQLAYKRRSHAWFVAYTPYKKPKYAITVLIEHGGHGSTNGKMASNIVNYMNQNNYF